MQATFGYDAYLLSILRALKAALAAVEVIATVSVRHCSFSITNK